MKNIWYAFLIMIGGLFSIMAPINCPDSNIETRIYELHYINGETSIQEFKVHKSSELVCSTHRGSYWAYFRCKGRNIWGFYSLTYTDGGGTSIIGVINAKRIK